MSEKNVDQIVLELLQKVEDKKKQIGNAERPSWITNCSFGYNQESNSRINIQVVRDLEVLVDIHAFLTAKRDSFQASLLTLKLKEIEVPFKYMGFSYNHWVSDIETRISQLKIKAKKDELANLEARVNALVSPEQRRAIELDKLVKEIG